MFEGNKQIISTHVQQNIVDVRLFDFPEDIPV